MDRIFEWDEIKNQANILKHGMGFEEAIEIFDNTIYSIIDTRHDYGEKRMISIGKIQNITIVVVVHTDRNGRTRIISARPASKKERMIYHEKTS